MSERNSKQDLAEQVLTKTTVMLGDAPVDVDALCKEHPHIAEELRMLASVWHLRTDARSDALTKTESTRDLAALPDHLGPYKILALLGEGGMGNVYLAEQRSPVRRRIALKVIKLGMDTKHVVARFDAERQALAMMDHPNIAKVFDAGADPDGRAYFTMEYVQGQPINRYCDENRLSIRQRVELLLKVCRGVHHAHKKGVVHRDLKPANILVTTVDGEAIAKIIDFGIAKAMGPNLTEHTYFTAQGQIIGTPEYMSPEQTEVTAGGIDHRTDAYALGVVLYELLVGVLPFDTRALRSGGWLEIRRTLVEVEPPKPTTRLTQLGADAHTVAQLRQSSLRELTRRIKGSLEQVVRQAMAKRPEDRYESVLEFAADLQRWLDKQPVRARGPGLVLRVRRAARAHPRIAITTGVALTGLIGFSLQRGFGGSAKANARTMYTQPWTGQIGLKPSHFGRAICSVGDINADGHPDVLAGSPQFIATKSIMQRDELSAGRADVFSGKDGEIIRTLEGEKLPRNRFGNAVAGGGDVNGDGTPDAVVGAWGYERNGEKKVGAVFAYSGGGGARKLWMRPGDNPKDYFGQSVAVLGDLDGDACHEVVVGAPQTGTKRPGYVRIFSGSTGEPIGTIRGDTPDGQFGFSLAALGDLDGDGTPEFLVGACFESCVVAGTSLPGSGAVHVYSYKNDEFQRLVRLSGEHTEGQFGWRVARAGDYNGDGTPDFMASSCMSETGVVRIYSGDDYRVLATLTGPKPRHEFGRTIGCIGDLDGDGCDEIAVGTMPPRPHAGYVLVFAGRSGEVLCRIEGAEHGDQFGLVIGCVGDLDRDGAPDLAIGAPLHGASGVVYPISGRQIIDMSMIRVAKVP